MKLLPTLTLALLLAGPAAMAQQVPVETATLGKQSVTLHLHPFLTPEEVATLQVVASNEDALKLFITRPGRHSAMAVAPAEGFIRNGQPVESAKALSDLPNAEKARQAALAECNSTRKSGADCVVVLEIAPVR